MLPSWIRLTLSNLLSVLVLSVREERSNQLVDGFRNYEIGGGEGDFMWSVCSGPMYGSL